MNSSKNELFNNNNCSEASSLLIKQKSELNHKTSIDNINNNNNNNNSNKNVIVYIDNDDNIAATAAVLSANASKLITANTSTPIDAKDKLTTSPTENLNQNSTNEININDMSDDTPPRHVRPTTLSVADYKHKPNIAVSFSDSNFTRVERSMMARENSKQDSINSDYYSNTNNNSFVESFDEAYKELDDVETDIHTTGIKKVLHKTMTTGSKALRMLGSNVSPKNSKLFSFTRTSTMSRAISKKQLQKRLLFKNGNINISRSNIDKRRRRYLTDIFTTLIDIKWRYNVIVFGAGFFFSWTIFAMAWYFISYLHNDLAIQHVNTTMTHKPCIEGVTTFSAAILFSIETQQTIGYGIRYTTEQCPEAILIMMIQSSVGVMIQSFMVGVVFAKLSRPKKRSETLMFSKNAVINLRDGKLCLICRVADMRKSHIVEAHVRMYLIKKKVTQEGEIIPLHMYDLNVGWDKGLDRLFLVWPLTIEHTIDQNSPFWTMSAEDLKKERFEIAVILEGIVESTGMTTQARSSYLPEEILWGHRFEKLITFQKEGGTYKIDYSRFNSTSPIDTPTCSAKDLQELSQQEHYGGTTNTTSNDVDNTLKGLKKRKRKTAKFDGLGESMDSYNIHISSPEIKLSNSEPNNAETFNDQNENTTNNKSF